MLCMLRGPVCSNLTVRIPTKGQVGLDGYAYILRQDSSSKPERQDPGRTGGGKIAMHTSSGETAVANLNARILVGGQVGLDCYAYILMQKSSSTPECQDPVVRPARG